MHDNFTIKARVVKIFFLSRFRQIFPTFQKVVHRHGFHKVVVPSMALKYWGQSLLYLYWFSRYSFGCNTPLCMTFLLLKWQLVKSFYTQGLCKMYDFFGFGSLSPFGRILSLPIPAEFCPLPPPEKILTTLLKKSQAHVWCSFSLSHSHTHVHMHTHTHIYIS